MPDRAVVEAFLRNLHGKMMVFNVRYRPRDKNFKSLVDLEITSNERLDLIKNLRAEDCFSGPNADTVGIPPMPDYFEFGKEFKGETIYIKINIGRENKDIDCMSFHIAERAINYPLKNI
jgi:hypothetical protein